MSYYLFRKFYVPTEENVQLIKVNVIAAKKLRRFRNRAKTRGVSTESLLSWTIKASHHYRRRLLSSNISGKSAASYITGLPVTTLAAAPTATMRRVIGLFFGVV